jgi:glycerol-3-phosphate O-acyltransferase
METRPVKRKGRAVVKPYEPNPILKWFYDRYFAHITVDDAWSDQVRDAARKGVVVYVMRSISFLDFLCLDFLTKRFALPLVRFVNDLGLWILEPFGKGGRRLRFRRQIPEDRALEDTVRDKFGALLFLRRPPKVGKVEHKGRELEVDLIRTLVEAQRKMDEPILLCPQTFVWTKRPAQKKPSLIDLIFGPREWPGRIRVLFQFLFNYRNAVLSAGEPWSLKKFMDEHQDLTDSEIADKIRYALLRIMERERSVVLGPKSKTPGRIRDELLRSPRVAKHIRAQARAKNRPVAKIEREARRELRRLCAAQNPYTLAFLHRLFANVWNRIYDGLEVDQEGLAKVRDASRDGAIVLLPSHKSHVDYLILSDVMYMNAMSPPLIAAGDNLNFWPIGPILRGAGAFFIRRSFKGKKLYSVLVDAYMRKLLLEGFSIEFFLEGGRSRTGKLLSPKYGLLSMVVDACLMLPGQKVSFVPISIGYERIVEERSYVDEQAGAEKAKENIGGLLKTPRVLRSRYGRLYLQFGEPLAFEDAMRETIEERGEEVPDGAERRAAISAPARRALVQKIAHRVVYRINQVTVVTPAALVATVVLAHQRRGISFSDLVAGARRMSETLDRLGARFATTILREDGTVREDTIQEATRLFMDGKLMTRHGEGDDAIFTIPEERRIAVEYYKNNILHFFVPSAMIAAAVLTGSEEALTAKILRERVRKLSRLFKFEFMYRADATFDEIFEDALAQMLAAGELERVVDRIQPAEGEAGERVTNYAMMLRTYFETYRLAVRGATVLLDETMGRKEWVKRTLSVGQRMYLAGELELRESLSKMRLETAIEALKDLGVLRYPEANVLAIGEAIDGPATLEELEAQLAAGTRAQPTLT